jgi:hypothetical protein
MSVQDYTPVNCVLDYIMFKIGTIFFTITVTFNREIDLFVADSM